MTREIEHQYLVENALWRQGLKGTLYRRGYLTIDPGHSVRAGGGGAFPTWCGILIRNRRKGASEWPTV